MDFQSRRGSSPVVISAVYSSSSSRNTSLHRSPMLAQNETRGGSKALRDVRSVSTSISPNSLAKSSSSGVFDEEAEVETNLYFPTFARRSSSRSNQIRPSMSSRSTQVSMMERESAVEDEEDEEEEEDWRPRSSRRSREEEDHDDIFELDNEEDDKDFSPDLGSYTFESPSESRRRTSNQSSSSTSTSTNDLHMVWDEEDRETEAINQSKPKVIRQSSLSGSANPSTSPKWAVKTAQQGLEAIHLTSTPPISLPFVRQQARRPSENHISPPNLQWRSYKGASATTLTRTSRSNSATSIVLGGSLINSCYKQSSPLQRPLEILSSPNSPPSSSSATKNQSGKLSPLPLSRPELLSRKRSATDPLIAATFLARIRSTESGSHQG